MEMGCNLSVKKIVINDFHLYNQADLNSVFAFVCYFRIVSVKI